MRQSISLNRIIIFLIGTAVVINAVVWGRYFLNNGFPAGYDRQDIIESYKDSEVPVPANLVPEVSKDPSKTLAKVGAETIYQADIEAEKSLTVTNPLADNTELEKRLLEKIVKDSIILQAVAKPEQLTPEVFNSQQKNYLQRLQLVGTLEEQQRETLRQGLNFYEYDGVMIWYNNLNYGQQPIEERRAIALEKITRIHQQVQAGQLTIAGAVAAIRADQSLADIDYYYINNASLKMRIDKVIPPSKNRVRGQNILLSDVIKQHQQGDLTEIIDAESSDIEQFFTFGQIVATQTSGPDVSYVEWFAEQQKTYAPTYY